MLGLVFWCGVFCCVSGGGCFSQIGGGVVNKGEAKMLNATMHKALRIAVYVRRMFIEAGFEDHDMGSLAMEFREGCQITQRLVKEAE